MKLQLQPRAAATAARNATEARVVTAARVATATTSKEEWRWIATPIYSVGQAWLISGACGARPQACLRASRDCGQVKLGSPHCRRHRRQANLSCA